MREGWIECSIEDVGKVITGGTPSKKKPQFYSKNDYPFYKPTDLNAGINVKKSKDYLSTLGYENSRKADKNSILVTCIGATIGKTGLIKNDGAFNQQINALIPFGGLSNVFIYYQITGMVFQQQIKRNAHSTTLPILNKSKFSKLKLYIPPYSIQKAIVKKIEELFSSLDSGIADLKKAQDQLVIYRQAVLKKAFEGELTKEWRVKQTNLPSADELLKQIKEERHKHYEQQLAGWKEVVKIWERNGKDGKKPKKPTILKPELDLSKLVQQLTDLPNEWTYINLDYAVYKLGDGLHGTPKYSETGDYYFINGNNLDNGKINIKPNTKRVDYSEFLKYRKDLNADTIFVSINGTIGNVSFYNNEKVILGKSACYFNLLSGFNKNYIKWRIGSQGFKNYAFKNATGSTIKNVPLRAMRNYTFALCSKEEQYQIVQEIESRLSVSDKVEKDIADSLEKAQALRQSILKKAFEGTLLSEDEIAKCKADKDYESASVMLERIKKEKS